MPLCVELARPSAVTKIASSPRADGEKNRTTSAS
jgi:hypothetical protein